MAVLWLALLSLLLLRKFIRPWLYDFAKKITMYLVNFWEIFAFFFFDWLLVAALLEILFVAFPTYFDHSHFYSFNFSNYFKSLFSVFVFFTTNNSPDLLIKSYPTNSVITTVVIASVWINNILLIGLMIGLTHYKMKVVMLKEISRARLRPVTRTLMERLADYPNASKLFIKKLTRLCLEQKNFSYIDIQQTIDDEQKKGENITKASERIFVQLKASFEYELAFAILNVAIVFFAMWLIQLKDFTKYQYYIYVLVLSCISLLDLLNHLLFYDITHLDGMWKAIIDGFLNVAVIVMSCLLIFKVTPVIPSVKLWALFCLAKLFRFFLIYFKFNRQKVKAHVLYPLFRYSYDVLAQVIVLFIVFASIGVNIFGGNINSYAMDLYNDALGTDVEYEVFNFNTFVNSMITLFIIMLNNNWPVLANLSVITHNQYKRPMKFMFVFFKFSVNYIFVNSLIAFMIQIFNDFDKRQRKAMTLRLSKITQNFEGEENVEVKDEDLSDIFDEDLSVIEDKK